MFIVRVFVKPTKELTIYHPLPPNPPPPPPPPPTEIRTYL